MPFDGTSAKVRLLAIGTDLLSFSPTSLSREATAPRAMPAWHSCRRPESVDDTIAVLARARALLADELRWCRGSFARSWLDLPLPPQSSLARRFCAVGAIMRAGRELGLPTQDACIALEWQTGRRIEEWNDDLAHSHSDVTGAFDAALAALAA